jgi:hypothetical protein
MHLCTPLLRGSVGLGSGPIGLSHRPLPTKTSRLIIQLMGTVTSLSYLGNARLLVTRGLRVLREQLFLRLLLTTRRASEYTLDFRELPRYVEAKLT